MKTLNRFKFLLCHTVLRSLYKNPTLILACLIVFHLYLH